MTSEARETQLSDEEIEEVVCPRCFANTGESCETPAGEVAVTTHAARRRKAESILEDLATLGHLPELGPETEHAAGPPPALVEDQPAQDDETDPEPAVARGRLQAQGPLDERRDDHGHRHGDGDAHPTEAAAGGVPGMQLEEPAGEGQEEESDEVEGRGHYPDVSGGHVAVIPEGGARG
jgi:hypothetical protein